MPLKFEILPLQPKTKFISYIIPGASIP